MNFRESDPKLTSGFVSSTNNRTIDRWDAIKRPATTKIAIQMIQLATASSRFGLIALEFGKGLD
jgi:hypothetical protein